MKIWGHGVSCFRHSLPTYWWNERTRYSVFSLLLRIPYFWRNKFHNFYNFLQIFQNLKPWSFLLQPCLRNVRKAKTNRLFSFCQLFLEFEIFGCIICIYSQSFEICCFLQNFKVGNPILPGENSKLLNLHFGLKSHFIEIPFYRECTVSW